MDLRAGAGTREGRREKRQEGYTAEGAEGAEEGGREREGRSDGREWEENGSRNIAGAPNGTPGDAKCVTEILGGGQIKKLGVDKVLIWSVGSQENNYKKLSYCLETVRRKSMPRTSLRQYDVCPISSLQLTQFRRPR